METNLVLKSPKNDVPARSFFCLRGEYERIFAFGKAMGWENRSYEFVVAKYRETLTVQ
jgi:hypothetical protein